MVKVATTYKRQLVGHGCWLGEEAVELEADCVQHGDVVLVAFTEATLARLAELGLDAAELIGCEEAVEEAFYLAEQETCRVQYVRQRLGKTVAA